MKSFKQSKGQWRLLGNLMCLLPIFLAACGGSLGKIQPENIDVTITQSEVAIDQARKANADTLAPTPLGLAESYLQNAKEAAEAKQGLEAMRLAYDALTEARLAEQEAMYKSQESGMNAIIKQKEAEAAEVQEGLRAAEARLEAVHEEIQQLDSQRGQLRAEMNDKIRQLEQNRQQAQQDYGTVQAELNALKAQLNTTKQEVIQAQNRANTYESQLDQLKRELALAQSMTEEARKAAEQARAEMKAQAQAYSKQLDRLDQKDIAKQRDELISRKAAEAREYVQQQQAWLTPRTGRTSLTNQKIAAGKEALNNWYLAWASKDIDQHLIHYAPDIEVEQIVVRSGTEKRTVLNRRQVVSAVGTRIGEQWVKTNAQFDADGDSVIGIYRLSRLAQNSRDGNAPALYDVWVREVWVHQVRNEWQVYREGWKIYAGVPKYSIVFD